MSKYGFPLMVLKKKIKVTYCQELSEVLYDYYVGDHSVRLRCSNLLEKNDLDLANVDFEEVNNNGHVGCGDSHMQEEVLVDRDMDSYGRRGHHRTVVGKGWKEVARSDYNLVVGEGSPLEAVEGNRLHSHGSKMKKKNK